MLRRNARRAKGSHPVAVGNFASPTGFDKANPNRPKFDRATIARFKYALIICSAYWASTTGQRGYG